MNTVHEKGTVKYTQQDSLDESGGASCLFYLCQHITHTVLGIGGNLNAASRQALMQKLARIDQPVSKPQSV